MAARKNIPVSELEIPIGEWLFLRLKHILRYTFLPTQCVISITFFSVSRIDCVMCMRKILIIWMDYCWYFPQKYYELTVLSQEKRT